jgi:hypothetical protein
MRIYLGVAAMLLCLVCAERASAQNVAAFGGNNRPRTSGTTTGLVNSTMSGFSLTSMIQKLRTSISTKQSIGPSPVPAPGTAAYMKPFELRPLR